MEDQDKSKRIQVQLSESLNDQLDQVANDSGVTKSAIVRVAVERELALDKELATGCSEIEFSYEPEAKGEFNQLQLFDLEEFPV
jgi:metal-responsive CopG/Arc/MetJ family transcriptional regulator